MEVAPEPISPAQARPPPEVAPKRAPPVYQPPPPPPPPVWRPEQITPTTTTPQEVPHKPTPPVWKPEQITPTTTTPQEVPHKRTPPVWKPEQITPTTTTPQEVPQKPTPAVWSPPSPQVRTLNQISFLHGARCSSVVRAFAHGAMGRRIDPSWWTHWAISISSQCSMPGVTKAVVCANLSVRLCIYKNPCC